MVKGSGKLGVSFGWREALVRRGGPDPRPSAAMPPPQAVAFWPPVGVSVRGNRPRNPPHIICWRPQLVPGRGVLAACGRFGRLWAFRGNRPRNPRTHNLLAPFCDVNLSRDWSCTAKPQVERAVRRLQTACLGSQPDVQPGRQTESAGQAQAVDHGGDSAPPQAGSSSKPACETKGPTTSRKRDKQAQDEENRGGHCAPLPRRVLVILGLN